MYLSIVKNDIFNISNRIKSIDKKYYIVYNHNKNRYEVHYNRAHNTYELSVPYKILDARTIDLVLKTKIQHQKEILEQIEQDNLKLTQKKQKEVIEKVREKYEC